MGNGTIKVGSGGPGSRYLSNEWPNEEGLIAGETKQENRYLEEE